MVWLSDYRGVANLIRWNRLFPNSLARVFITRQPDKLDAVMPIEAKLPGSMGQEHLLLTAQIGLK
jgi:hypothetical protein